MKLNGGCLCGLVRYRISIEPERGLLGVTYCQCTMCRKATGGGYAMLVPVPREQVAWVGRPADTFRSSNKAVRGFCGRCGSPLFYLGDGNAAIEMTAGSLDNPSRLSPNHHDGIESRLPRADCHPHLPGRRTGEALHDAPG